ncbi:MAG: TolC family protein [Syntrophobacterales bacterium]|nr:TolC family protein [Syntrophobacterales bacterium]
MGPLSWRSLSLALALALLAAAADLAGAGGLPPDLEALIAEAQAANPEVKERAALTAAARERIRSAGALDDPEFAFVLKDIPTDKWTFNRDPMTQKMVELNQKLPFPGKRRLRSEVAAAEAHAEEWVFRDKVKEIRTRVIAAYWNLAWAQSSYDLTARNKGLWEQVVRVAEARYGVGQGTQTEVLQAQVELGNYLDKLLTWQQRLESWRAVLNALRNRPPETPLPRPRPPAPRPFTLQASQVLDLALERPQLQALKAQILRQEKALELARKEYYPDFTLGVAYGFKQRLVGPLAEMNNPDMFSAKIMVNLPVWVGDKIKPRIREEEARHRAAREAHQAAWTTLSAAVQDRVAKLERLSRQIQLYEKGLLPQARQAAEAALPAYQTGMVSFAQLYQSQIAAYNAELMLQEYLKDFEETWAELEFLAGQELPRRSGGRP